MVVTHPCWFSKCREFASSCVCERILLRTLPFFGAKHSPPAQGPFGGSRGHLATLAETGAKLTPLIAIKSMMMTQTAHSRVGETRRGTWQSVLPYGVPAGEVVPWGFSYSRSTGLWKWCEAFSSRGDNCEIRRSSRKSERKSENTLFHQNFDSRIVFK